MKTKLMTVCLIALAGVIGWQQRQIHQCQKRLDESAYLKSAISSVSERANKTENMLSKMYAQPDGELFKLMMSAAQEPFKDYEREEKIKDLESKVVTLDRKIEDRVMDVEAMIPDVKEVSPLDKMQQDLEKEIQEDRLRALERRERAKKIDSIFDR